MIDRWLPVVRYVPVDHMEIEPGDALDATFYSVHYEGHYTGVIRASVLGRYLPW